MAQKYVATTGNDSTGTGAIGNPWLTLDKAWASISSGDTINFAAGTYGASTFGNGYALPVFSGAATLQGAALVNGVPTTIFNGAAGNNGWVTRNATFAVNNIRFTNAVATPGVDMFYQGAAGAGYQFTNCVFDALSAANNVQGMFGFTIGGSTSTFTFTACAFKNMTKGGLSPVVFNFDRQTQPFGYVLVNCTLYQDLATGSQLTLFGYARTGNTVSLTNCIFMNTATGTGTFDNGETPAYSGSYLAVNNFTSIPSAVSSLTGYQTADPLFVDPANLNFNLRPGSPAIDAGIV